MRRPSRSGRRGLSLVEMVVVVLVGIVLIVSLLPAATGLLRQEQALSASVLSIETLPFLVERLEADFARAASAGVESRAEAPSFRIVLSPAAPEDPDVAWSVRGSSVTRVLSRTDAEGQVSRSTRTWQLPGSLALFRGDPPRGRVVLTLSIPRAPDEILAFAPGRPTRWRAP